MSIKLYDGYQIVGNVEDSLSAQKEWLEEIRERIQSEVKRQALADVVKLAVHVIDTKVVWPENVVVARIKELLSIKSDEIAEKVTPYTSAIWYYRDRDKEDKNYQCEVVFLRSNTKTLAMFFGTQALREIWDRILRYNHTVIGTTPTCQRT